MYFEDIYQRIKPFWRSEFSLKRIEETETYIESIAENWEEINDIVLFSDKQNYSEWDGMMVYTMYKTITMFGLMKWETEKVDSITLDEIPITLFEETFRKNMEPVDEIEGNLEYLAQYKGFRNPPDKSL